MVRALQFRRKSDQADPRIRLRSDRREQNRSPSQRASPAAKSCRRIPEAYSAKDEFQRNRRDGTPTRGPGTGWSAVRCRTSTPELRPKKSHHSQTAPELARRRCAGWGRSRQNDAPSTATRRLRTIQHLMRVAGAEHARRQAVAVGYDLRRTAIFPSEKIERSRVKPVLSDSSGAAGD